MMAPRHILITAGGSGLGLAMAQAFLALGDWVAVTDIDANALAHAQQQHPTLTTFTADCADEAAMNDVFNQLQNSGGQLDVLMANAGTAGPTATIEDVTLNDWKTCLAVNLDGAFLACRRAAALMKERRHGVITLTASTAGLFGYPYRSAYATAKWGIIGLMKTLAMELGPYGIRVNAICPGAVEGERMNQVIQREATARNITEQAVRAGYESCVSMKRFVKAEDIANTAVFLASTMASNISGLAMTVDGHTEKVTA